MTDVWLALKNYLYGIGWLIIAIQRHRTWPSR
jgi:hypothetical protein